MTTHVVFVYGREMRGHPNEPILRFVRAEFVGRGWVYGGLVDCGTFPGLVLARDAVVRAAVGGPGPLPDPSALAEDGRVNGELYRIPDARALEVLDRQHGLGLPIAIEGSPWDRELTIACVEVDGVRTLFAAEVYTWRAAAGAGVFRPIDCGCWSSYLLARAEARASRRS